LPPRLLGPDAATIVEPLLREKYGFVKRDVFNGVMRAVSRHRWFRFVAAQSPRVRRRADEPLSEGAGIQSDDPAWCLGLAAWRLRN
jgi:hypothetical protein